MHFLIRPAQSSDAAHIAHVHVESWKTTYSGIVSADYLASLDEPARAQSWHQAIEEATATFFVAQQEPDPSDPSGIFGFIAGGPIRDPADGYDAELYAIYLLTQNQHNGAGRALVRTLASSLHAKGLNSIIVWVLEANPAVDFYKRLGAVPVTKKTINIGGQDLSDLALGWHSLDLLL